MAQRGDSHQRLSELGNLGRGCCRAVDDERKGGPPVSTILAPSVPLYQQGFAPVRHQRRHKDLAAAPRIPLYQLGWLGAANVPQLFNVGAGIATQAAAPAIVSAAGLTAGTVAAGALTAGIGAGVVILGSLIAGLWAKHEARIKGATQENQAINSAVQTFDAGIKAIFAAANSSDPSQNVSGSQAAQQVQQLLEQFFAQMAPYTHAPGAADASNGGANCGSGTLNPAGPCMGTPGGHMCDKTCTATCCVGCQDLYPTMLQAVAVLNNPAGGSVQVCTVYGSKYGANLRSGYTLTYTPPKVTGAASLLSDLTGGGSSSGSPNWLLLGAAALAAWMVLS